MMRRSIMDKIFIVFLALSIVLFVLIFVYTTFASKKALVEDKQNTLINESQLIAEQAVVGYVNGRLTREELQTSIDYFAQTLDVSIWYANKTGAFMTLSKNSPSIPGNINYIAKDFDITKAQSFSGSFYGVFDTETISVIIPIFTNGEPDGAIFLHTSTSSIDDVRKNIMQSTYIPFLLSVIVCFTLLAFVSGKIMRPIRKITAAAQNYAKGNFEQVIGMNSDDEIGELANTLDYMADELSKLDDYRKSFISNVSHDFRSPLTSIKGYVEAIKDGTIPPEKQDKYLDVVINETNRLTKLTTSLLELNMYDTYGLWLVKKDFDIVNIVKDVINTYEGRCIDQGVPIYLDNHCGNTLVNGDKQKIQQVVYNLVDNALKFTPSGKSIYIKLEEEKNKVFVSIIDQGKGISDEEQKKVWTRFYKVDRSRGRDKNGAGLGLAITKEIIKAHGEEITLTSIENLGSEFRFSIAKAE